MGVGTHHNRTKPLRDAFGARSRMIAAAALAIIALGHTPVAHANEDAAPKADKSTTEAKPKQPDPSGANAGKTKKADTKKEAPKKEEGIGAKTAKVDGESKDFEIYLDRLMMAESGGRTNVRNPRSSAYGPYQFIKSTWLSVARRYFAEDVEGLPAAKILALRSDLKFARKAAAAYSRENAAHLASEGVPTTYGNLRLAFLLGPGGAVKVLQAKTDAKVAALLGRRVIRANPFMAAMTAQDLIKRAEREISIDPAKQLKVAGLKKAKRKGPRIRVRCNLSRASCRRWLALKKRKLAAKQRVANRKAAGKRSKSKSR